MTRLQQLERDAQSLTDVERAAFAAHLLATLPIVLSDEDNGITEVLRCEMEMDATGDGDMGWDELKKGLER